MGDASAADPFHELVYDSDARAVFAERWPQATFEAAPKLTCHGRFEVTIPGVTADDVYPVLIYEGWSGACLGFEMALHMPEKRDDVHRWIDRAQALKDGTQSASCPGDAEDGG